MINIPRPYLVFLGDATDRLDAKTGAGLVEWRPEWCIGQYRFAGSACDLGIPDINPAAAREAGAKTMIIGGATFGGVLNDTWLGAIEEAIDAGLNIASGLHDRLKSRPNLVSKARAKGVTLFDIRGLPADYCMHVASGRNRTGKRLLTVGTDCAVGKKFTALAIDRKLREAGVNSSFRATGQTGVLISGGGFAIDAIIADFLAGAVEDLSPDNVQEHWDIIEGQGSLHHPAYAAVSLGLLHGSQPDAFVICHAAGRDRVDGYPEFALPSIAEVIDLTIANGRRLNPNIHCVGISLNCSGASLDAAAEEKELLQSEFQLPVFDPATDNMDEIAEAIAKVK